MRLNVFLAQHSHLSRRAADQAIIDGRVVINGQPATLGQPVQEDDKVMLDGRILGSTTKLITIMLNKPVGYVCSRAGQGSKTIYDLLPAKYHQLNPVGRLDKDSSGLLLLTSDGQLANRLTHPRYQKTKLYEIEIDKPLSEQDFRKIVDTGVDIGDAKLSQFQLVASSKQHVVSKNAEQNPCYFLPATCYWRVRLTEGRNRQIRRTFAALNYQVIHLHRIRFGNYNLSINLKLGEYSSANSN